MSFNMNVRWNASCYTFCNPHFLLIHKDIICIVQMHCLTKHDQVMSYIPLHFDEINALPMKEINHIHWIKVIEFWKLRIEFLSTKILNSCWIWAIYKQSITLNWTINLIIRHREKEKKFSSRENILKKVWLGEVLMNWTKY